MLNEITTVVVNAIGIPHVFYHFKSTKAVESLKFQNSDRLDKLRFFDHDGFMPFQNNCNVEIWYTTSMELLLYFKCHVFFGSTDATIKWW